MRIKEIRNLLGFALIGAVTCGAILGFSYHGEQLEAIRATGAISATLIAFFSKTYKINS